MKKNIPEFQDEVRHKKQGVRGRVIAKYQVDNKWFFDVAVNGNTRVLWDTPAENWETIRTEEEQWKAQ